MLKRYDAGIMTKINLAFIVIFSLSSILLRHLFVLNLKAKTILPRERETLNSQFALLLAKRFRASPTFVDSEEEEGGTVVVGSVPPGDSKARWFEFTLKLTLAQEIRVQDKGGAE